MTPCLSPDRSLFRPYTPLQPPCNSLHALILFLTIPQNSVICSQIAQHLFVTQSPAHMDESERSGLAIAGVMLSFLVYALARIIRAELSVQFGQVVRHFRTGGAKSQTKKRSGCRMYLASPTLRSMKQVVRPVMIYLSQPAGRRRSEHATGDLLLPGRIRGVADNQRSVVGGVSSKMAPRLRCFSAVAECRCTGSRHIGHQLCHSLRVTTFFERPSKGVPNRLAYRIVIVDGVLRGG